MKKKLALLLFSCCASTFSLKSQTLVNKVWDAFCATPDTIDFVQTTIDPIGRLVMTGNTKTFTQQNNALTVVRNSDGTIAWSQTYNGTSNGSDYGASVTTDASGNIYVGGATYSNTTSSYDYLVLKYSSSGSLLWHSTYNGTGNGYDVITGILVDNSGNVFVAGASKGIGSFANLDYTTIKYNSSGTQQWVSRYNNVSLPDVPCGLAKDNSGNIFVAGGSANSIIGSDIFVVKYNPAGTQTATYRHNVSSGNGWDKATSLFVDGSGNVFVTGCVYQNNTTSDMRTIKLTNSLVLQWSATYNGENKDDCANSLALDGSGNVCITGWTAKTAGGKDFTTIKYNASGTQQWVRRQPADINSNFGEAKKVKTDNAGNIFVAGEMDHNGNKDFLAIKYDSTGQKKWEKYFNGTGNGTDKAFALNLYGDEIYISGKTTTGTGDQYGTVKYVKMEVTPGVGTYQGNQYISGEVTVRFDPAVLNHVNIDNKDLQFGIVADFVHDSTILKMNSKLGTDVTKWKMAKIFPSMQTTDIISTSRVGEQVDIPSFWAAFRIFPQGIADTIAMDSLNKVEHDIWYAEVMPIVIMQATANDPIYAAQQSSLHSTTTYPNASINIEPAWDIQVGQPFIRVGVYDSGIDQTHDELNNGKVGGGYDYFAGTSLTAPYDQLGHGTACAGVIGAYRNNTTGIAGVAGGDGTASNPGVMLYDCRINDQASNFASVNNINHAIVQGATSQSAGGFGLQVMSNSWTGSSNSQLLEEAVRYAHANAVVFVAARGNFGLTTGNQLYFPACYFDPMVIAVGSSGVDGNYQSPSTGGDAYESNYTNVDLVAPGTSQIIQTTQLGTNGYITFNGTSAATPHVAGVVGLMLSQYNQPVPSTLNLAPEDVQHIMQISAVDISNFPASSGFDDYTGAGRVDAGAALAGIMPGYRVHHYSDFQNQGFSIVPTQLSSNAVIVNAFNQLGIPAGTYWAETFKVTHTFTISDIASTEIILGVWTRTSSTLGIGAANPLDATMRCNITSYSSTQMIIETYVYHFYQVYPTGQAVNYWIPTSFPAGTRVAATIYTYDPTFVGVEEQITEVDGLNLFPNPAGDAINAGFLLNEAQQVKIEIFDATGRIVDVEQEQRYDGGYHEVTISTGNLAEGLYIVMMTTDNGIVTKKILVQHNGL
ncbi:hypothetical protein BH09BAC5_BH09BAC5_10010 [soil metagenome]